MRPSEMPMSANAHGFGYGDHFQSSQPSGLGSSMYSNIGDAPSLQDNTGQQSKFAGNSQMLLVLRQPPVHARVAMGKEKDRKPIDPPPVVQLIDKRNELKSDVYNSPYLFLVSTLVPEDFDIHTKLPEAPSTHLTGSIVSSIHRLKDSLSSEGGFFVFGDLCVKQEGRYRLRFSLYERDPYGDSGSFAWVSELVSNVFTVYAPRRFPGMTESTTLTRLFSDQGVKLRLRKETRTISTRKRGRPAVDTIEALIGRDAKRPAHGHSAESPSFNYDHLVASGSIDDTNNNSPSAPIGFPAPPFHSSNIPMSRHISTTLPFATSNYYMTNFSAPSFQ